MNFSLLITKIIVVLFLVLLVCGVYLGFKHSKISENCSNTNDAINNLNIFSKKLAIVVRLCVCFTACLLVTVMYYGFYIVQLSSINVFSVIPCTLACVAGFFCLASAYELIAKINGYKSLKGMDIFSKCKYITEHLVLELYIGASVSILTLVVACSM